MTDPAGITRRGAEQSAPRSRSGLSAADSHGVARSRAHVVSSHAREEAVLALHRQPPDSRRQLERRFAFAERRTHDLFATGARRAVERRTKARTRLGASLRGIGRIGTELCSQRSGATPGAVARLTSSRRDGEARHVRVVALAVLKGAAIASREASRFPVERVTCPLKCQVQ